MVFVIRPGVRVPRVGFLEEHTMRLSQELSECQGLLSVGIGRAMLFDDILIVSGFGVTSYLADRDDGMNEPPDSGSALRD